MIKRNNVGAGSTTFGQKFNLNTVGTSEDARVEADVWLNIGLLTDDDKYPIITLPYGIPIDTQKPLDVRRGDSEFLRFVGKRNALLKKIQQAAEALGPGEEAIIGGTEDGLVLQLRRRQAEAAPAPESEDDVLDGFVINISKAA